MGRNSVGSAHSPVDTGAHMSRTTSTGRSSFGGRLVPNQPRPDNPHRSVRVEDDLWEAARIACAQLGTTRGDVMRQALRDAIERSEREK